VNGVYLDHNATTPMDERVREAMQPWSGRAANASSMHAQGRAAREAVELARSRVAAALDASPDEVVFTSGGTESNNLALKGLVSGATSALAISMVEHAAVRGPAFQLRDAGHPLIELPVDAAGRVDAAALHEVLERSPVLVSIMWANNETGVIQDIPSIVAACRKAGVPLHTDAVQAVGKVPVSFRTSGVQLMSVSAHKLYGPQGVGALVVDRALSLAPLQEGGGQERGLRGGTEPVAAIVGFGMAAAIADEELAARAAHAQALRDRLERGLSQLPQVTILGSEAQRLPNTTQFVVDGIEGEALLHGLDRAGYAVSSGSACASGSKAPSHVLTAMGMAADAARGVVRASVGQGNTDADIDGLLEALQRILQPGAGITGGAVGGW
jgi:cysteine desulfurase